jgi:hypothetical protein
MKMKSYYEVKINLSAFTIKESGVPPLSSLQKLGFEFKRGRTQYAELVTEKHPKEWDQYELSQILQWSGYKNGAVKCRWVEKDYFGDSSQTFKLHEIIK